MAENRTGYFSSPFKTATEFISENAILPIGVYGTESDTQKTKCGDGVTAWTSLNYTQGTKGDTGDQGIQGIQGVQGEVGSQGEAGSQGIQGDQGEQGTQGVQGIQGIQGEQGEPGESGGSSGFKPLTMGYAGDSIADRWGEESGSSPIFWFKNLFYKSNVFNLFNSSVPGTLSSDLLTNQIDQLELLSEKPDVMVVHTTQNDQERSYAEADTSALNVTTYCERALASGVQNIIIAGHPPKIQDYILNYPNVIEYLNRKLSSYANTTDGVHYIDCFTLWRETPTGEDPSTLNVVFRSDYTVDGVHPNTKAMFELGKKIAPILQPLVQGKELQSTTATPYHETDAIHSNLLGIGGLMLGNTGEYNSVVNNNVAGGVSGRNWLVTDGSGVLATPTIVTGVDGYPYQQLDLSGTATADVTIKLEYYFGVEQFAEGLAVLESILHLNNISGVDAIDYGVLTFSREYITIDGQDLAGENELHITTQKVWSNTAWRPLTVRFEIKNGQSPKGTIKLGRCGIYRQVEA